MRDIFEFLCATLPWIAMGLLFVVFFVRVIRRKKDNDRHEDYISEGTGTDIRISVSNDRDR